MTPGLLPSDSGHVLGRRAFLRGTAGLALGTVAPRTVAASADTTQKRELVVLQWNDLTALDPHAATYMADCRVVSNIFDTLLRRHPDGTLHPGLATTWQRAAPTVWHLTLRSSRTTRR
jgi:ABC-type transport system substrate-binding protein